MKKVPVKSIEMLSKTCEHIVKQVFITRTVFGQNKGDVFDSIQPYAHVCCPSYSHFNIVHSEGIATVMFGPVVVMYLCYNIDKMHASLPEIFLIGAE